MNAQGRGRWSGLETSKTKTKARSAEGGGSLSRTIPQEPSEYYTWIVHGDVARLGLEFRKATKDTLLKLGCDQQAIEFFCRIVETQISGARYLRQQGISGTKSLQKRQLKALARALANARQSIESLSDWARGHLNNVAAETKFEEKFRDLDNPLERKTRLVNLSPEHTLIEIVRFEHVVQVTLRQIDNISSGRPKNLHHRYLANSVAFAMKRDLGIQPTANTRRNAPYRSLLAAAIMDDHLDKDLLRFGVRALAAYERKNGPIRKS